MILCSIPAYLAQSRPAVIIAARPAAQQHVTFSRTFAPSDNVIPAPETPRRTGISLNGSWQFQPVELPSGFKPESGAPPDLPAPEAAAWSTTQIKIPSPWNVNAFNVGEGGDFRCYPSYPKEWEHAQMGWLKRSFTVPASWKGKRVLLRFGAIAGQAQIIVNGHKAGENFDIFLPVEFDITNALRFGSKNEILVGVRKASLFNNKGVVGNRPYPGGSMWGQSIVGIWQDVSLTVVPALHVSDDYVRPQVSENILSDSVTLRNDGLTSQTVRVRGEVSPWENLAGSATLTAPEPKWRLGNPVLQLAPKTVTIAPGKTITVTLQQRVGSKLRTWSPEKPNLYGLVISVERAGQTLDKKYTRFGWREFTFHGNHQWLNGKPLELRGDSWHFLGIPQMTRRYAWAWYKALKDAHGNAVRLHAQPYPALYLDVADEMGICVLDETAIWGSDAGHAYADENFWARADDHVRRLILRDRNHASVFGWSVSNEVGWYINSKYPDLMARLKQGWQSWLSDARSLDPSRPWISTDGDGDASGIMPTSVSHYAGPKDIVHADKPFGEGETGCAYYATPKQAAQFTGPRAYESQQGRMEGTAREAYNLIKGQREVGASYASVFNLVWYGLQPLELGLSDTTRAPELSDGIFFSSYLENQPGVQPERLGPYTSTLNPGYDSRLPLYRTWPLADAIKSAYTPAGPISSPWDTLLSPQKSAVAPKPTINRVVALTDDHSLLPNVLHALGATVDDINALDSAPFIVIDGTAPPAQNSAAIKSRIAERVRQGATCLILGVNEKSLPVLNELLPKPVRITNRQASSLVITSPDPLINGLDNADLYFSESDSGPVIRHGLEGPLISEGRVILSACPTEWRRWNNNPEPIKTAAALRSERETKPAGAALVEAKEGQGRYLLTTIDASSSSMDVLQIITHLMANAGVKFEQTQKDTNSALDMMGHLTQALACGSFGGASVEELYRTDHVGIGKSLRPQPGSVSAGLPWAAIRTKSEGAFAFKNAGLKGPTDNAAVYLSFWVWSPRALDNLLVEPNMPKLDLLMGSDDGCQVWLNSQIIKEDRGTHPMTADSIVAEALPMQRGWNQFIVKVVQGNGDWAYTARLRCSDAKFLLGLRSSIVPPKP